MDNSQHILFQDDHHEQRIENDNEEPLPEVEMVDEGVTLEISFMIKDKLIIDMKVRKYVSQ